MVKGHPLSLAVHLEHATNLAGTKGSNGYLFSTHEGWNDTRTVKSTSTNSSRRFTVANDALEQGFALVTCIGPGLSIDLLPRCGTTSSRILFLLYWGGGEGWFIGNGDASSTCLDRKYRELDSQSRHSRTRPRRRIISLEISLMNNSRPSCRYLRICFPPSNDRFCKYPPSRTDLTSPIHSRTRSLRILFSTFGCDVCSAAEKNIFLYAVSTRSRKFSPE